MKSKLYTLDRRDFLNGLLMAVLTALISGLIEVLKADIITWEAIKPVLIAALSAALSYLLKSFGTNSQNQLLTREPA